MLYVLFKGVQKYVLPMDTVTQFNKSGRIRKILLKNILIGYIVLWFPMGVTLLADLIGVADLSLRNLLFIVIYFNLTWPLAYLVVFLKKSATRRFANNLSTVLYINWYVIFGAWTLVMNELRILALVFSFATFIYLIAYANMFQSFLITNGSLVIYGALSFYAIYFLGQDGSITRELFNIAIFFVAYISVTYFATLTRKQREEVHQVKQLAEETRDKLWGEMELAKKIQTILLPKEPFLEGFEITAFMEPALNVGGDYYDIINTEGRDWICIGDVSGHGVSAGLIMMMVQSAIQTVVASGRELSPSQLLAIINRSLTDNIKRISDMYMTITVIASHRDGTFSFSGLHQDILVFRAKTGSIEAIKTRGLWLGLIPDIKDELHDDFFELDRGDVCLLYTDGITEAIDSENRLFSDERLADAFKRLGNEPTEEIRNGILRELTGFICKDDVTMVIMRRL